MRLTNRGAIIVIVLSLALCALQAGLWAKTEAHVRSETEMQARESRNPPSEIPGVVGLGLLVVAGVLLSFPEH
jgi:uncharacterized membrane protein YidH (DUF202 family)